VIHADIKVDYLPHNPKQRVEAGRAATALYAMLKVISEQRSTVILPAISCPALVASARTAGLDIVLCDIELETYNMDLSDLESILTELEQQSAAVVGVHNYGHCLPVKKVLECCERHGAVFIEDCCLAIGARADGELVGTFSDYSLLSFGYSKQIELGAGGLAYVPNSEFAAKMKK